MSTQTRPPQKQAQPGRENEMNPRPRSAGTYRAAGKLEGRRALITGGDSGIGRAVALLFAEEGADVAILYLSEEEDAVQTRREVEQRGRKCVTLRGDVGSERFCAEAVETAVRELDGLDIVVNSAAEQHLAKSIEEITEEQLERTFRTNIFGYFFVVKAALRHLKEGAAIINTTSVTAFKGSGGLLDYSATKGAIVAFTRSLSAQLVERGIRVNAVAPGPIWTPLIPATFPADAVAEFGADVPMKRPGEPEEVATCYVFLASSDSSYMTGQVLHPNGGTVVGG